VSTDFQRARTALGAHLRALRAETGLTGRELAARLGWAHSKVSKLETGRQTATEDDLAAWAAACGREGVGADLVRRLAGLETTTQSWRRRLAAGHAPVQASHAAQEDAARHIRLFEPAIVPGIMQTPDYARAVLTDVASRHGSPVDIEAGVRERMRRQEVLYRPGRLLQALLWEPALYTMRAGRGVMVAQLDRLLGLIGMDTVSVGIVPLAARVPVSPKHGFWVVESGTSREVVVDTWHAELWLTDPDEVALYARTWALLDEAAVYGQRARAIVSRARTVVEAT
jgi:transcriptional regulator with XRE-family HTH domain